MVANRKQVVLDHGVELVGDMSIDLIGREPVAEAGTIVQVTRVDDEQVYALLLGQRSQMRDERGKISPVTAVVWLGLRRFQVTLIPAVDISRAHDIDISPSEPAKKACTTRRLRSIAGAAGSQTMLMIQARASESGRG